MATNSPTVRTPEVTARPPSHRFIPRLREAIRKARGRYTARVRISRWLRSRYCWLSPSKARAWAPPWSKAFTRRIPVRFSWTKLLMWPKKSWIARKRECTREAMRMMNRLMSGTGTSTSRVSSQSMRHIMTMVNRKISTVSTTPRSPYTKNRRICWRSFVARAIRSPVRCPW